MKIRRPPTTYKPRAIITTYYETIAAAQNHILEIKRKWRDKTEWIVLESPQGFFVVNRKYL